jgi:hypothetical protein
MPSDMAERDRIAEFKEVLDLMPEDPVATRNGDLQTKKELEVFLRRLEAGKP